MSDNSAALRAGAKKLRQIIDNHISDRLFVALDKILESAVATRLEIGHNMTGNTINAYAGGIFHNGKLVELLICNAGHRPIRVKLRMGEKFLAGKIRWDGEEQYKTFLATVDTDATEEPSAAISFIQSYKPQSKDWEMVVTNGVEYATWQMVNGIDVLTGNYQDAFTIVDSAFTPISD